MANRALNGPRRRRRRGRRELSELAWDSRHQEIYCEPEDEADESSYDDEDDWDDDWEDRDDWEPQPGVWEEDDLN
jgi:hypothetical protein